MALILSPYFILLVIKLFGLTRTYSLMPFDILEVARQVIVLYV